MEQEQMEEAVSHARALLRPDQQALPDELARPLGEGLAAWEAGQEAAGRYLAQALAMARQMNYD